METVQLRRDHYEKLARTMIPALEKRQMGAVYCPTAGQARETILSLIPRDQPVGWGGSRTMEELGVMDALHAGGFLLCDRDAARTGAERRQVYAAMQNAGCFLTSANAITRDGVLINVDGRSDRVSFLCHGPRRVVVAVGMNKVVDSIQAGLDRVWQIAAPLNAAKNGRETPCAATGVCTHCLAPQCICSNIVITRRSAYPQRIQVVLVGETLGF